jgi:photosystem II stability/assembly factor-like uncharacterized protein
VEALGSTGEIITPDPTGSGREEVLKSEDGGASWSAITGNLPKREVHKLVVVPATATLVYAGLRMNAASGEMVVFKSATGGQRWEDVRQTFPAKTLTDWAIDPTRPHIWYAFTTRRHFRSTDEGTVWKPMRCRGLPRQQEMRAFVVDPSCAEVLYIGTRGGVFKSTDGGDTWRAINVGLHGDP